MSPTSTVTPSETLELILHHLPPLLLVSSLSVKSFLSRWRTLHSQLSSLHSSLSQLQPTASPNPLLSDLLLTSLHPLLLSLLPLSSRCLDPSLPTGKLHLQSDLDIAISSLSLNLRHLHLLLQTPPIPHSSSSSSSDLVHSFPSPSSSSNSDLLLFFRDLFTRLQIGTADLKQKALDSLLQLLSSSPPATVSSLLADHFDLSVLVRLLDPAHPSLLRHHAASVVSILSSSAPSRRAVFDQGALGPLLRLLESGPNAVREQAAAAIYSVTSDPSNAWAVSAYAGVPALVAACRPGGGSPAVHALAAGSLKNVCAVEDARLAMVEEGAVAALVDLLATGNALAKKNSALCVWSLAAEGDDEVRVGIFREGGLEGLVRLVGEAAVAEPEIMEHALRAILALSASVPVARGIASMPEFFIQLSDLIRIGHSSIQQVAACLVAVVSPGDEIRRSMARSLPALIKMLEYPKPATAQEAAADALTTLLTVRSLRKELSKDEKSIRRLVQMLDPRREEVFKRHPVSVVLVLSASGSCRRKLADAGACHYLQKLVEVDVPGAKKALHRITGNRLKNLFSIGWRE